ncbi:hypothetical protein [Microvirga arabica]|uniref:hypothetical protein n=1 Tax=Microvirga arabica TaxID=1128671 RepID=UPI003616AD93
MNEQWTFYLLIFGAVFLAFQGLRGVYVERRGARRAAARFATIDDHFAKNREEVELLKKRNVLAGRHGILGRLNQLYVQSGSNFSVFGLILTYTILFGAIFLVTWMLKIPLGFAISSIVPAIVLLLVLTINDRGASRPSESSCLTSLTLLSEVSRQDILYL